jgi:Ca2+-transporting ATPase
MNTEMGKIATALTEAKEEDTPFTEKAQPAQQSAYLCCTRYLRFHVYIQPYKKPSISAPMPYLTPSILAISLAVAAIPEGLAAVVTIVLSIGVTKMVQAQRGHKKTYGSLKP